MLWASAACAILGVVAASFGVAAVGITWLNAAAPGAQAASGSIGLESSDLLLAAVFLLFSIGTLAQVIARRPFGSTAEPPGRAPVSSSFVAAVCLMCGALACYRGYSLWSRFALAISGTSRYPTIAAAVDSAGSGVGSIALMFIVMSNLMLMRWFQITRWGSLHTTSPALSPAADAM